MSETLTLNQTKFSCIMQPYTRLTTKNPYPIPESLLFSPRNSVIITVQQKQNFLRVQQQLRHVFIFKCHVPGNLAKTKFSKQLISFLENDTHSRPKLSHFYTPSQTKLLKTTPFTAAHTHIAYCVRRRKNAFLIQIGVGIVCGNVD